LNFWHESLPSNPFTTDKMKNIAILSFDILKSKKPYQWVVRFSAKIDQTNFSQEKFCVIISSTIWWGGRSILLWEKITSKVLEKLLGKTWILKQGFKIIEIESSPLLFEKFWKNRYRFADLKIILVVTSYFSALKTFNFDTKPRSILFYFKSINLNLIKFDKQRLNAHISKNKRFSLQNF